MNKNELNALRNETLKRMQQAYEDEGMERILKMIVSFHSCQGGAYYNINDYLNSLL